LSQRRRDVPAPRRRSSVPAAIAILLAALFLGGLFFALETLAPPKGGGGSKPADSLSLRTMLKAVSPMLRERCTTAARAALAQRGMDQGNGDVDKIIDSYCGCAVDRGVDQMSLGDLLALKLNPSSGQAAAKMKDIMQQCQSVLGAGGHS
jgi:hypothetical protein